jgi:hypothetical protein
MVGYQGNAGVPDSRQAFACSDPRGRLSGNVLFTAGAKKNFCFACESLVLQPDVAGLTMFVAGPVCGACVRGGACEQAS